MVLSIYFVTGRRKKVSRGLDKYFLIITHKLVGDVFLYLAPKEHDIACVIYIDYALHIYTVMKLLANIQFV